MTIQERLKAGATMAFVILALAVVGAFGIASHNAMPNYAGVYLIPATKTYVPLPCMKRWKQTPGHVEAALRTAGEARNRRYRVEDGCQEYLMGEQQSIGSSFLRDKGLLAPVKEWWDQPYRTDTGMIYPGKRP